MCLICLNQIVNRANESLRIFTGISIERPPGPDAPADWSSRVMEHITANRDAMIQKSRVPLENMSIDAASHLNRWPNGVSQTMLDAQGDVIAGNCIRYTCINYFGEQHATAFQSMIICPDWPGRSPLVAEQIKRGLNPGPEGAATMTIDLNDATAQQMLKAAGIDLPAGAVPTGYIVVQRPGVAPTSHDGEFHRQ